MRLLLVLSSFSPLFILWGIKGISLIPDVYFISVCGLMALGPTLLLLYRIHRAKENKDQRRLVLGKLDDRRYALLSYLFAMLLPFYRQDITAWRDFAAIVVALILIVFLFWHLRLHYLNLLFAMLKYRIYSVAGLADGRKRRDGGAWILITHRDVLLPGETVTVWRITNTVYLEAEETNDSV